LDDIPTNASGDFDDWFDALSADDVGELYTNLRFARKIKKQLRGDGGFHEMLMVSEAPHWKRWEGVTAELVKEDFAIAISDLNERLAKGWRHSTGKKGSKAPNSTTVHNQLQRIIRQSNSLEEFKSNLVSWADEWIEGGYRALPQAFQD
jgi:hypothetical protein